jgi:hypothetical protein
MTASETEALTARWRRLEHGLDEVRAAVNSPDPHRCPDAVARALCALYDLWEFWATRAPLPPVKGKTAQQDAVVSGDDDGETTAALVHARGSLTHVHAEFGAFTDTFAATVFSHFGCWRWQEHSDVRHAALAQRDRWYGKHVKDREVLPPLEAAARWMRARPELELTVPA